VQLDHQRYYLQQSVKIVQNIKDNAMAEWRQIGGKLNQISVGSVTNVWGVNESDQIYRYTGDDNHPWVQIDGRLTNVTVAADGTVWGVNSAGNIYRYVH
jgi:hypothetical protein